MHALVDRSSINLIEIASSLLTSSTRSLMRRTAGNAGPALVDPRPEFRQAEDADVEDSVGAPAAPHTRQHIRRALMHPRPSPPLFIVNSFRSQH